MFPNIDPPGGPNRLWRLFLHLMHVQADASPEAKRAQFLNQLEIIEAITNGYANDVNIHGLEGMSWAANLLELS